MPSASSTSQVKIPFLKVKVPVVVDIDRHPAIELISQWGEGLKNKIADACFAQYRDKVASIGQAPSLPRIRQATEVWKHLEIREVRIDASIPDTVVVYVIPAWDIDEQMEWCTRGRDELVYVDQVLYYRVDGYAKPGSAQSRRG
jgi:hypothetical protein